MRGKQWPSNSARRSCSGPGWAWAYFLLHIQGLRYVLECQGASSSLRWRGLCWFLFYKHGIQIVVWISAFPEYWVKFPQRFWVEFKLSGPELHAWEQDDKRFWYPGAEGGEAAKEGDTLKLGFLAYSFIYPPPSLWLLSSLQILCNSPWKQLILEPSLPGFFPLCREWEGNPNTTHDTWKTYAPMLPCSHVGTHLLHFELLWSCGAQGKQAKNGTIISFTHAARCVQGSSRWGTVIDRTLRWPQDSQPWCRSPVCFPPLDGGWVWPNQATLVKEGLEVRGWRGQRDPKMEILLLVFKEKLPCCGEGYVAETMVASRYWRPPYNHKELDSANTQWTWKRTLGLRWDHIALGDTLNTTGWDSEQRIQMSQASTIDPKKLRE